MLKKFLFVVVPLMAPLVAFGLYALLARWKAKRTETGNLPNWANAPWTLLICSGVMLSAVALVAHRFIYDGSF